MAKQALRQQQRPPLHAAEGAARASGASVVSGDGEPDAGGVAAGGTAGALPGAAVLSSVEDLGSGAAGVVGRAGVAVPATRRRTSIRSQSLQSLARELGIQDFDEGKEGGVVSDNGAKEGENSDEA